MLRRIEVFDFEVLLAVAESGSFRKAAIYLGLRQSGVSRRLQKLEEALGVSLFERRRSGAHLTPAGWCFVKSARGFLRDVGTATKSAQAAGVAESGVLHVGIIASLSKGAPRELISAFVDKHPAVDICFAESDRSELLTLLSHRLLDVVIAAGEPVFEGVDSLLLTCENVYLAVSCDSSLAMRERLLWHDVSEETFIVSTREPGPEIHDYIVRCVSDLGRRASVESHLLGREGIMNLVGLGLGVSLVADHWRGVSYPNVAFIPIGKVDEQVPFSLAWRPENDNPALRRFLSLAREVAKAGARSSAPS